VSTLLVMQLVLAVLFVLALLAPATAGRPGGR